MRLDLVVKLLGSCLDPVGLSYIHIVLLGHGTGGSDPDIAVAETLFHFIEQPFTQCPVREDHFFNVQRLEHGTEDRDTCSEDRFSVIAEASKVEVIGVFDLEDGII